ncbi:MAG: type I secretion system permease/ATPase [Pseudomonadota bacterium]
MQSVAKNPMLDAVRSLRKGFWLVGGMSLLINLLLLTAPMYMLQIYDRVLSSHSVETLIAITSLAIGLLLAMALFDMCRSRVLVRVALRLDERINRDVFKALLKQRLRGEGEVTPQRAISELDLLRQFISSNGLLAFFDAPWLLFFLILLFIMHPLLGAVSLIGALLLLMLAVLNELTTRAPFRLQQECQAKAGRFAVDSLRNAEVLEAMGMAGRFCENWHSSHAQSLSAQLKASERGGSIAAFSRALRMGLQVAILGAGALLVIDQQITPGIMIAASILMSRAVAPVEQAISQWRSFVHARGAYNRLKMLLHTNPAPLESMALPPPSGALSVESVFACPPGVQQSVLNNVTFKLKAGETLGVIGPTASGKSTLARLLAGVWQPRVGVVRLDGADIANWPSDDRGAYIGYLPQDVELFSGTVAENIACFDANAEPQAIIQAAQLASVHELILGYTDGYDTEIGEGGAVLSGGQRQRIGLARALYGQPALVVLDEPNANLDGDGDRALQRAITHLKSKGTTVVLMAHRPSTISQVDRLLVLRNGRVEQYGPKSEVLARLSAEGQVEQLPRNSEDPQQNNINKQEQG